jgi:hypothetical protein
MNQLTNHIILVYGKAGHPGLNAAAITIMVDFKKIRAV